MVSLALFAAGNFPRAHSDFVFGHAEIGWLVPAAGYGHDHGAYQRISCVSAGDYGRWGFLEVVCLSNEDHDGNA